MRVAVIHRTQVDHCHCSDAIMGAMAYRITGVCSIVGSGADQRKHQSSASLAFGTVQQWDHTASHRLTFVVVYICITFTFVCVGQ